MRSLSSRLNTPPVSQTRIRLSLTLGVEHFDRCQTVERCAEGEEHFSLGPLSSNHTIRFLHSSLGNYHNVALNNCARINRSTTLSLSEHAGETQNRKPTLTETATLILGAMRSDIDGEKACTRSQRFRSHGRPCFGASQTTGIPEDTHYGFNRVSELSKTARFDGVASVLYPAQPDGDLSIVYLGICAISLDIHTYRLIQAVSRT